MLHKDGNGHTTDIGTTYSWWSNPILAGTHLQELPAPTEGLLCAVQHFSLSVWNTAAPLCPQPCIIPSQGSALQQDFPNLSALFKPLEEMCSQVYMLVSPTPIHITDDTI